MDTTRLSKIGRLIQKDLADFFQKHASEFFLNTLISVTVVRVSPDLSHAKVYLSIFPAQNSSATLDNVNLNNKQIRYKLGQLAGKQLRKIPELEFFLDDSLDYAEKIDELLHT